MRSNKNNSTSDLTTLQDDSGVAGPSKLITTSTVTVLALCLFIPHVYSDVYHDFFVHPFDSAITSFTAVVLTIAPIFFVAAYSSRAMTLILALVYVLFFVYLQVRANTKDVTSVTSPHVKALIILATVSLVVLTQRLTSPSFKHSIFRFLIGASLTWLVSLPLGAAYVYRTGTEVSTLDPRFMINAPPSAIVFLVLDELSPAYNSSLLSSAVIADYHVRIGVAKKAGPSTLKAIPSMLTGKRFDNVVPCGVDTLCGSAGFSAGRLRAALPGTDVIGFWHPYCEIKGLRSCYRVTSNEIIPRKTAPELVRIAVQKVPIIGNPVSVALITHQADQRHAVSVASMSIRRAAFRAPFWTEGGGLLFIHIPLPHPSGEGAKRSLKVEYEENILSASTFVAELTRKLSETFGEDFTLIVTSDHPLRVSMWCSAETYSGERCAEGLPTGGENVPFIAITPKNSFLRTPTDVDLLGILTTK